MRNLERFLVYLSKDPLVKNSQIFFDFLTIEKDSDFEKRKKIYNRLKTPIELKDIKVLKIILYYLAENKNYNRDNNKITLAIKSTII